MNPPRRLRFTRDYVVLLNWSAGTEGDDLPDVERLLPADLVERIRTWGEEMEGAYGELHLDDPPPVAAELAERLEAQYCRFRQKIRGLGFELVPRGLRGHSA